MSRANIDHALRFSTSAAAVTIAVHALWTFRAVDELPLLIFPLLGFIASFIRVPEERSVIRVDAVAMFPALLLTHSVGLAVLVASAAAAGGMMYEIRRRIRPWKDAFVDESSNVVATAMAAFLYTAIVPSTGSPSTRVGGYLILLILYFALQQLLSMARKATRPEEVVRLHLFWRRQAKALLLISPVVLVEALMYSSYGAAGAAIAFLPVLLVAQLLQFETEQQFHRDSMEAIERQLKILSKSSRVLFSAEGEEATVTRLVELISEAVSLRAAAVITWETLPETRTEVFRFGSCQLSEKSILSFARTDHLDDAPPPKPTVRTVPGRAFGLTAESRFQLLVGIQTAEVIYGVLIWESDDEAVGTSSIQELLHLMTMQCALSLQDQLLRREMQAKATHLQRSADTTQTAVIIARELFGEIELVPALSRIASTIREALGFRSVLFSLLDEKRDAFVPAAHAGLQQFWDSMRSRSQVSREEVESFLIPEFRVSNSYRLPHQAILSSGFGLLLRNADAAGE